MAITRTFGPIHFEDLDPHRFEDLIRELIYDFKDWQTIEATGRGGNDDGFDIRAYEKLYFNIYDEQEDEKEVVSPMDGNVWMIQCKREKQLGPTRIKKIIEESISKSSPHYGYILAAPVNFSKMSYDIFRTTLQSLGVMEFYLWGKSELEHMLHMPKNDRILFTFFGISLISKRKSMKTDIRQSIANKNKIKKILGFDYCYNNGVLIRDINDRNYPFKEKYTDNKARWGEYKPTRVSALGIEFNVHRFYSYIDFERKVYDVIDCYDLEPKEYDQEYNSLHCHNSIARFKAKLHWDKLNDENKKHIEVNAFLHFSRMEIIDEHGDTDYPCLHIYTDYENSHLPFKKLYYETFFNQEQFDLENAGFKRINFFNDINSSLKIGQIHDVSSNMLNEELFKVIETNGHSIIDLYFIDDKFSYIKENDLVITNTGSTYYVLSNGYVDSKEILGTNNPYQIESITNHIGRKLKKNEKLFIIKLTIIQPYEYEMLKSL